jgi:hypothetical protein
MKRNLMVLGCSAFLAVALALTSYAKTFDTDLDGVPDQTDNCDVDPNGPSLGDCAAQEDGDGDGFGNACDTDTNQAGQTDLGDVSATLSQSKIGGTILNFDFDCDGVTALPDVSKALADSKVGKIPDRAATIRPERPAPDSVGRPAPAFLVECS